MPPPPPPASSVPRLRVISASSTLAAVLAAHKQDVRSVAALAGGAIATGSRDHSIRVWQLYNTLGLLAHLLLKHSCENSAKACGLEVCRCPMYDYFLSLK